MNITEIEDQIDSEYHHKEFRTLGNINKLTLYKKLYADGLLRGSNAYFSYNTATQTITSIIDDIKDKFKSQYNSKESGDEIFGFIENESSKNLYLVIWHYPSNVSIENIYKRAQRYNRMGALA